MAEINYDEIKTEYISSDVSLRSLARKYGISISALSKRAKKDCWETAKETIRNRSEQITIGKTIDARASIAENCIKALTILAEKTVKNAELLADNDISGKRQLSGVLKDMRDMGAFELQSGSSEDNTITVRFEVDEYGE